MQCFNQILMQCFNQILMQCFNQILVTPVAAHRLSMKYERYDFSQRFLANLIMGNKTRVLSFTVTRANIEILPHPFRARPVHLYLSF